jgi:hypothetical protein
VPTSPPGDWTGETQTRRFSHGCEEEGCKEGHEEEGREEALVRGPKSQPTKKPAQSASAFLLAGAVQRYAG